MVFKAASQTDFLLRSDANQFSFKALTTQVCFSISLPHLAETL